MNAKMSYIQFIFTKKLEMGVHLTFGQSIGFRYICCVSKHRLQKFCNPGVDDVGKYTLITAKLSCQCSPEQAQPSHNLLHNKLPFFSYFPLDSLPYFNFAEGFKSRFLIYNPKSSSDYNIDMFIDSKVFLEEKKLIVRNKGSLFFLSLWGKKRLIFREKHFLFSNKLLFYKEINSHT